MTFILKKLYNTHVKSLIINKNSIHPLIIYNVKKSQRTKLIYIEAKHSIRCLKI